MIYVYLDSEPETDQKAQRLFVSYDTMPKFFKVLFDGKPEHGVGYYRRHYMRGYKKLTTRRIT